MLRLSAGKYIHSYHLVLFAFCFTLLPGHLVAETKAAIGWLEHVNIEGNQLQLKAKIDTGADSSSVNARILEKWKTGDTRWVRFLIINNKDKKLTLEKEIVRYIKIKRRKIFSIRRPVIKLAICLGNIEKEIEVNLADRSNFKYPVLIGRDYLHDTYLVDSSVKYSLKSSCH